MKSQTLDFAAHFSLKLQFYGIIPQKYFKVSPILVLYIQHIFDANIGRTFSGVDCKDDSLKLHVRRDCEIQYSLIF